MSASGTATEYCCTLASNNAGGATKTWANETFHNNCCKLNSKYCGSCAMQYAYNYEYFKTNVATCCSQLAGKISETNYRNVCCSYVNSGNGTPNYSVSADNFRAYCCANGGGNTGNVSPSGTNQAICCTSYAPGQGCCKAINNSSTHGQQWNGTANSACCNYASGEPSTTCCNAAQSGSWGSGYNGNTFRAKCCNYSSGYCGCGAITSASTHGISYTGSGDAAHCCNYTSGVASTTCCEAAKASNWANGGTAFRQKCCGLSDSYCADCAMKYNYNYNSFKANTSCCSATAASYKTQANWQNVCCTAANPGALIDSDIQSYCCSNSTSTALKGGGTNNVCCRAASAQCCDVNSAYCTCTSGSSEGSKTNWRSDMERQ